MPEPEQNNGSSLKTFVGVFLLQVKPARETMFF